MNPDTGARAPDAAGGARPGRVRWRVLAVVVWMSFVAYLLRTNMSVAGESMMRELELSPVEFGWVLAAFAWGYAMFQFPGGVLGDVYGSRRALAWIAVGWAVVNLLTGLVPGLDVASAGSVLGLLVILRFAMGVVQAPVFPVIGGGVIGAWFPVSGWALPNGLTSAGLTVGAAATGPVIAWLAETFGWRLSFVLTAPLGLATAAVWWWYGRDHPSQHPAVEADELALIAAGRPEPVAAEPGAWRIVLRDRNVLLLSASYFCMNYVFYIFFNWFFVYLVDVRGFGALESGFLATAPWLVGAVGATAGGYWCDAGCRRRGLGPGCRTPGVVGLVLVSALLIAGAAAPSAPVAITLLSLCFGCTQLTEGAYWSAAIGLGGRHAAAASGVMNTGGNVVGGFGALLVPLVARHWGWVAALSTGSAFALVGAALWLAVDLGSGAEPVA